MEEVCWPQEIHCGKVSLTRSHTKSLFKGVSTFRGLFNAKPILVDEKLWHYLTYNGDSIGQSRFIDH